jgi:hypothetical protein
MNPQPPDRNKSRIPEFFQYFDHSHQRTELRTAPLKYDLNLHWLWLGQTH